MKFSGVVRMGNRYGEHYCKFSLHANMYGKSCHVTCNNHLDKCFWKGVIA